MRRNTRLATAAGIASLLVGGGLAQAGVVKVKAGSYSGQTSEKVSITFKIVGRSIESLHTAIGYNRKCGQGGGPGYTISVNKIKIESNGGYSAKITLKGQVAAVKSSPGTLKGKASGSTVTGKIVDSSTAKFSCNGYTETFTARLK